MSRLDRHVAAVQNKLAMDRILAALAWMSVIFAAGVWLTIVIDKLFQVRLPRQDFWFFGGLAFAGLSAVAWGLYRRPSRELAAVAIDQKLGLKEKLSTALYVRDDSSVRDDPFAVAALRDAEITAQGVIINYRQHFPFHFPKAVIAAILIGALALLTTRMSPLDLFGKEESRRAEAEKKTKVEEAQRSVERALATVEAIPRAVANEQAINLAKAELINLKSQPITDPDQAKRSAAKALQDLNSALKQQISTSKEFAEAKNQERMFRQMQQPSSADGPVSDAHNAMVKGQFDQAVAKLDEVLENFDKLDEQEKEKTAQQMKQLAQALQKMAEDPAVQQQMQQQMQQMGMNQQQAAQAQQLMQQAAQGDQQAQQQLQQMAQQMMQQMNNGQGPNPQQQQQLQQMMNQLQAQANNQQAAQQMQQAAQQMAQAMQQQQQQGQQQQPGQQQQQAQQGQPQQMQQQGGQQMNQAMQAMRQQLQAMQAIAQDAQQIQAAQQAAQAAQANAQDGLNGGQQGAGQDAPGGQWAQGDNQNNGQDPGQWNGQPNNNAGPNQGGQGAGDRDFKSQAPYTVKKEISKSEDNAEGKLLASTLIKDNKPIKGESTITLQDVAAAAQAEQTDEVDQERISPQAQKVVRDYFKSMESAPAAAPSQPPQQPAPKN